MDVYAVILAVSLLPSVDGAFRYLILVGSITYRHFFAVDIYEHSDDELDRELFMRDNEKQRQQSVIMAAVVTFVDRDLYLVFYETVIPEE